MANQHSTLAALFTAIADAIRGKTGGGPLVADQFPSSINAITTVSAGTADATATAAQILSGYTAYAKGARLSGTMANCGAVSQALNAGGSYAIPAGYHNGGGRVSANSLSGQTAGTATAGEILSGKTAWVNGSRITGTLAPDGLNMTKLVSACFSRICYIIIPAAFPAAKVVVYVGLNNTSNSFAFYSLGGNALLFAKIEIPTPTALATGAYYCPILQRNDTQTQYTHIRATKTVSTDNYGAVNSVFDFCYSNSDGSSLSELRAGGTSGRYLAMAFLP